MNCTNNSLVQQDLLNCSTDVRNNTDAKDLSIRNVANFLVCMLGMPGNLLVIAVYIGHMASSTRVYMFALAVADLAVCICGMILTLDATDNVTQQVVVSIAHTSVIFSIYLLALLSIERMLSVLRPYTFSLSSLRAKKILVAIALVAATLEILIILGRLRLLVPMGRGFLMFVTVSAFSIMTISYICMAAMLLKKARAPRNQVGAASGDNTVEPGPSTVRVSVISNTTSHSNYVKSSVKQAKKYRNISLSLIVTAVFVVSWLPLWLHYIGVPVPAGVRRMYLLNSFVNPFIYSVVSAMFRDDVRQFYCRTRSKCISCFTRMHVGITM